METSPPFWDYLWANSYVLYCNVLRKQSITGRITGHSFLWRCLLLPWLSTKYLHSIPECRSLRWRSCLLIVNWHCSADSSSEPELYLYLKELDDLECHLTSLTSLSPGQCFDRRVNDFQQRACQSCSLARSAVNHKACNTSLLYWSGPLMQMWFCALSLPWKYQFCVSRLLQQAQ